MRRRTYLASLGGAATSLAGVTATDDLQKKDQPPYRGDERVVYEQEDLKLRLLRETIQPGDTIEFKVTNTGNSKTVLGCHNPWAIQRYLDGEWRHVTWTGDRYYQMCATILSPGGSLVESITLSESKLEQYPDEYSVELRSGKYRFLLLGSSPYLAIDFHIYDSE